MYCKKCGEKIKEGNKFCTKCGFDLNSNESTIKKEDNINNKADGKAVASLVLGCISLFLSFTLSIIMFPMELVGLILGIASKTKCSEKTAGIIINVISMIISIVVFIILIILIVVIGAFSTKAKNILENNENQSAKEIVNYTWNCKNYGEENYSITFSLNTGNESYVWSKYDDAINNAIYGNYESNEIGYDKYSLKLNSSNIISNGALERYEYTSNYELEFVDGDNIILTSLDNASKYYCDIQN